MILIKSSKGTYQGRRYLVGRVAIVWAITLLITYQIGKSAKAIVGFSSNDSISKKKIVETGLEKSDRGDSKVTDSLTAKLRNWESILRLSLDDLMLLFEKTRISPPSARRNEMIELIMRRLGQLNPPAAFQALSHLGPFESGLFDSALFDGWQRSIARALGNG